MSDPSTSGTDRPLKRALVIAGGGDRGAFAVGALREMVDRGIDTFDVVTGTSTGGLIAPMAAIGEIGVLETTYRNAEPEDIYATRASEGGEGGEGFDLERSAKHALLRGETSLVTTEPLRGLIEEQLTPARYERLLERCRSGATQVRITAVNYRTGDVELIDPADYDGGGALSRDAFIDALMATSAVPVYFPPQRGIGERSADTYLDGALKVSAPVYEALELGAEELYVIALAPARLEPREQRHPEDLLQVALGTIGVLLDDVAGEDIRRARDINHVTLYLLQLQAYIRSRFGADAAREMFDGAEELFGIERPFGGGRAAVMYLIQPPGSYGDTLEFGADKMRGMYDDGRRVAARVLERQGEFGARSFLQLLEAVEAVTPVGTRRA